MKKLSIIIPYYNAHEFTNLCLESIFDCTSEDFEIILIDNGSSDEEISKLELFSEFGQLPQMKVIRNETNKGFPAAVNQGFTEATGDIICVLNNDLVVTPDWAEHLEWHLDHGLDVVGPRTNYIDGPQILLIDRYDNKEELYERAREHYKKNKHKRWAFPRLVGFCLMFKREVYEKIGGFDESFGIGNFEDDDWDLRAIEAGYRLGISRDVYLHHFGSVTHKLLNLDYNKLLRKNEKIFSTKWSGEDLKRLDRKNKEAIK